MLLIVDAITEKNHVNDHPVRLRALRQLRPVGNRKNNGSPHQAALSVTPSEPSVLPEKAFRTTLN
jgi:hypothetical protein